MSQRHSRGLVRSTAAYMVAAVMLFAALSLWTLIPLVWLWIGSQLAATQFPSMGPYAVVLIGVIVSILVVSWLLGHLNEVYLRLTGSRTVEPIRLGWLKSLRDDGGPPRPPTLLEAVIVGSVLISFIALVTWFFTLAGSPVD